MDLRATQYPQNPVLRAISVGRRRRILDVLLDRGVPVSEHDLVVRLAPPEQEAPITDGSAAEREEVRIDLVHVHLPALETAGLVEWDRETETVEASSHPALDDPRFRQLLGTEIDGLDAVLSGLSHDHRRIVLTVLEEARASVTRTDLAQEIARREPRLPHRDSVALDDVVASLHHVHLPTLASTNVIEYDPDTGRAAYTGHSALDAVFGIIFEPEERVADKFDGFLEGLHESYETAHGDVSDPLGWPHFWREPHGG